MRQDQYEYRLIELLDKAIEHHTKAEKSPPSAQHRLMLSAKETTEMANALSLAVIALSLSSLAGAAHALVDTADIVTERQEQES